MLEDVVDPLVVVVAVVLPVVVWVAAVVEVCIPLHLPKSHYGLRVVSF